MTCSPFGHLMLLHTAMIHAQHLFGLYRLLQSLHLLRALKFEYRALTCESLITRPISAVLPFTSRNPYFAISAIFLLGMRGVKKQLPLNIPPISQMGNDKSKITKLSGSLEDATMKMMAPGSIAREVLGDVFVDHFGGTREHEVKLWNEAVTNWEGDFTFDAFSAEAHVSISQWRDILNWPKSLFHFCLT